jgi:hypothetical protein
VQTPPAQTSPALHTVLQDPQFCGSICVSTQTPLQSVSPPAQTGWHMLFAQVSPAPQATPQLPQF